MSGAYYNENDPFAAQWLRNLIGAGLIAPGDVDERSIEDVRPGDLAGYTQCHFFAGIGGWSYALRLAGWADDRPVWTGSCPCQPFSAAGAGKAFSDERHLWPDWFSLIEECGPTAVFGEQVEKAVGWGWLDLVFSDLEKALYACGATVLPACSVGAPHIRNRLFFVAHSYGAGKCGQSRSEGNAQAARESEAWFEDGERLRRGKHGQQPQNCSAELLGDARSARLERRTERDLRSSRRRKEGRSIASASALHAAWSNIEWLDCTDGKARPVEPGTFPLAHGLPARMGRLRGYGNAISPQVAAQFIIAAREAIDAA